MVWYCILYYNYDYFKLNTVQFYNISDMFNVVTYACLSLIFFAFGKSEMNRIYRLFIFYAIAEFWALIAVQVVYVLLVGNSAGFNKVIIALTGVLLINFAICLFKLLLQATK